MLSSAPTSQPECKLADPICTYIFSVLVLFTTFRIIRDTIVIVLEGKFWLSFTRTFVSLTHSELCMMVFLSCCVRCSQTPGFSENQRRPPEAGGCPICRWAECVGADGGQDSCSSASPAQLVSKPPLFSMKKRDLATCRNNLVKSRNFIMIKW